MFLFGREFDPQREEPGTILSTLILINKMIDHVEDHVSSIRVQEIGLDLNSAMSKNPLSTFLEANIYPFP